MRRHSENQPRAAYVHVPFCRHRCGYCNFTVVADRDDLIAAYIQALGTELGRLQRPRQVDTLFLGGGTPTHLSTPQLQTLISEVLHWLPLSPGAEFSVEANPEDLDQTKMEMLAALGVTRLSLGAQSFASRKLALLERDHESDTMAFCVQSAQRHFRSVSLDLIFGTPGETLEEWRLDLERALTLSPNHVSTYGLTFEKGTSFWSRRQRGELRQIDEELERGMYDAAIDELTAAGYEHYEVSNFAQPDHRCRHNEVYWTGREYFAFGPGAARFVDGCREVNHRSTSAYLKRIRDGKSPVAEREMLGAEQYARECLVFGLRRLEGVDSGEFFAATGWTVDSLVGDPLRRFVEMGLLEQEDGRVRLTRKGLMISDSLWPEML